MLTGLLKNRRQVLCYITSSRIPLRWTTISIGQSFYHVLCAFAESISMPSYSTAIIMEIAYGHRVATDDDEYLQSASMLIDILRRTSRPSLLDLSPSCTSVADLARFPSTNPTSNKSRNFLLGSQVLGSSNS